MEETEKRTVDEEKEQPKDPKVADAKVEKKELKKAKAEIASLQKELEEARTANADLNDRFLRMMAEYDNFRKRSAKEKDGIYADAYGDCIANILPILDNLERAEKSDHLEGVKKGLELTVKAFDDALEKMGIVEVETKTFDPNLHNAVMHVEDAEKGEGEIVEVFQKGYKKGDRVIRYAMVKVAN